MDSRPARKKSMSATWRAALPKVSRMIRRPSNASWPRRAEPRLPRVLKPAISNQKGITMTTMTQSKFLLAAFAALALGASAASADSIPGLRGHDHTGITVPDVKAATAFFTDVIGCSHAMSFGPFSDDKGTFMQDVVNVNPRAVIDEGPAAGQSILYFFAPWGLQMELISYPKGMAYEKDAKSLLWMTTEPTK